MNMKSTAPMRVVFDDIIYRLQSFGGISEYWNQVTQRVAHDPRFEVSRITAPRWARLTRPRVEGQVFHSSYFRTTRSRGVPSVVTVHDLSYELGQIGSDWRAKLNIFERKRAYFSATALVCISRRTRDDLLRVYPQLARGPRIEVIHHGVEPAPSSGDASAQEEMPSTPFILFVGARSNKYKNFINALRGFQASGLAAQGYTLQCTGHLFNPDEQALIERLQLSASVQATGKVSRERLHALYRRAHALLYPSLYEGFGLPLLEAMQSQCPVVASNASCIPEIAGEAAWLVDGESPDQIGEALRGLEQPATRAGLIERGLARAAQFSWERSANAHAALYESLAQGVVRA